jgi:hypothetical protein
MVATMIIVGRPGTGKSQMARYFTGKEQLPEITDFASYLPDGWVIEHITDYEILLEMFQLELEEKRERGEGRFVADEQGGFGVKDFKVLREALDIVNRRILDHIKEPEQKKLFLVEFARNNYNDYRSIWQAFSPEILESAYCLYLRADIDTCMERVRRRASRKLYKDDTNVPTAIMTGYYREERYDDLEKYFSKSRLKILNTEGDLADTLRQARNFTLACCEREVVGGLFVDSLVRVGY